MAVEHAEVKGHGYVVLRDILGTEVLAEASENIQGLGEVRPHVNSGILQGINLLPKHLKQGTLQSYHF